MVKPRGCKPTRKSAVKKAQATRKRNKKQFDVKHKVNDKLPLIKKIDKNIIDKIKDYI